MGFLDALPQSMQDANSSVNNAATVAGGLDVASQATGQGAIPGSGALGHVGGVLAALGLANDLYGISQDGLTNGNGTSAVGNGLGLGAYIAGSSPAGMVMAAGAGGMALGNMSNSMISDSGLLGDNEYEHDADGNPVGRSWSDMAADWGTSADEWAGGGNWGTAAGLAATAAGSFVGTAGTIATAAPSVAHGAYEMGSAGLDMAGDAIDFVADW